MQRVEQLAFQASSSPCESDRRYHSPVAQESEHRADNPAVGGANPSGRTMTRNAKWLKQPPSQGGPTGFEIPPRRHCCGTRSSCSEAHNLWMVGAAPTPATSQTRGGPHMEFQGFPKMARLSRDVIVTEKIDGTNAQVLVTEDGEIRAGSRKRWITPEDDNFGFATWVEEHRDELLALGPGRHFGEWWGSGIQRGYGLDHKRFSLFNASRWAVHEVRSVEEGDYRCMQVPCCHVVPVLFSGPFRTDFVEEVLIELSENGSRAAKGFANPEGVVIYHVAAGVGFKKTLENDEVPKSLADRAA